jgi:hypothetical protein
VSEPTRASALEFRLTDRQRRRYARGLVGLAVMAWSIGLVRLAVTRRLDQAGGWAGLIVLAVVLAAIIAGVRRVQPVLVLDETAAHWQWGPRQSSMAWDEVAAVEIRERGTARRVLLTGPDGRSVLPVPLTGGSLIGPGSDPGLDDKVEVIRRWWAEHRQQ